MFVDGSKDVMIGKNELEESDNPEFVSLHPGWNILDMNGEFKDGFVTYGMDDFGNTKHIKYVDFTKFIGKRLNSRMFAGTSINELDLPNTIEEIEQGCFMINEELTKVILPKKIKKLSLGLFSGCINLSEINLHEGIMEIEGTVFQTSHIEKIVIPSTVNKIGDYFYNYYSDIGNKEGSVRFQSLIPPEFTINIFAQIDKIEVPMAAVETYKNIDIPGWKEKFGDKIVGY